MELLLDEPSIVQRVLDHIERRTTDMGDVGWREPVAHYRSETRLALELDRVFRRTPTPFCPSAALLHAGCYVAREAAGVPLVAARGGGGEVRVFRNACRHRGTQLACGRGRTASFVCPYHGWAYGLDGALRSIPHEHGFPGLDKDDHGLVPVLAWEQGGVVFVSQDPAGSAGEPAIPSGLLAPELELVAVEEQEIAANWKVFAESFLEGYHILSTHRETFYPVQFDNLNVVEHFGANSRITYPYRNIQKLRAVEPADRRVGGTLTFVYHFFPNVMIATFPQRVVMVVLEPLGVGRTRSVTYTLAEAAKLGADRPAVERDGDFVARGAAEDRAIVESIQRGLASEANEVFEFGRFEAAIVHFHHNLQTLLGDAA
jgi:phenylpropionate dioxygenase-like ring-hydroxylating dioxygenase large terminal subunit